MALKVPIFIVVSKVDLCSRGTVERTVRQLERVLKQPGCNKVPMVVSGPDDAVTAAQQFTQSTWWVQVLLKLLITLILQILFNTTANTTAASDSSWNSRRILSESLKLHVFVVSFDLLVFNQSNCISIVSYSQITVCLRGFNRVRPPLFFTLNKSQTPETFSQVKKVETSGTHVRIRLPGRHKGTEVTWNREHQRDQRVYSFD